MESLNPLALGKFEPMRSKLHLDLVHSQEFYAHLTGDTERLHFFTQKNQKNPKKIQKIQGFL